MMCGMKDLSSLNLHPPVVEARSLNHWATLEFPIQLFQYHLWEDYPFFTELPLVLSQKSIDCICVGLFLGTLFCYIDLFIFSLTYLFV